MLGSDHLGSLPRAHGKRSCSGLIWQTCFCLKERKGVIRYFKRWRKEIKGKGREIKERVTEDERLVTADDIIYLKHD